jgi:ferritin
MLSTKMIDSFNRQINREIYSAYLYMGMSSFAISEGYAGMGNWFAIQVQEELTHARMMYDYINQQSGRVMLQNIEEPPQDFNSAKELFEKTLEHERLVTSLINNLVDIAREEKDHATEVFLQWFVTEQVEEEANASDILQKFKLIGDDKSGLFMIDSELAKRMFTPPAQAA